MSATISTANLKEVFSYPFKDEKWISKLGILLLLMFLSFLLFPGMILMGYVYEIMRRVIVQREAPSLPEWDDWGEFLVNGFKLWGVSTIYSIPSLMLMIPYMIMIIAMPILMETQDSYGLPMILMFLSFGLFLVAMLFSLLMWVVMPPAWGHMIAKGEFGAAFRFKEFWPILRNNLSGFILTLLIYYGAITIVAFVSQIFMVTIVLCLVYPLVMMIGSIYMLLVAYPLFAQAYVEGVETMTAKAALLEAEVENA